MNYELIKIEFIKLKKEELEYIDNIANISIHKTLSDYEKLEIYRTLKNYEIRLNEAIKKIENYVCENIPLTEENANKAIIEFDINKNYLSKANFNYKKQKEFILNDLGIDIESFKFKLTPLKIYRRLEYFGIDTDTILNNQKLIQNPIYVFCGYYNSSLECCGPCFGNEEDYLYGIYKPICSKYSDYRNREEIKKNKMSNFEKDKIIIHSKEYVNYFDIKEIFEEELLNIKNKTLNDCILETENRIEKLNYIRSPEYKEKIILDRINKLYLKVKGNLIQKEILYSGNFLDILSETYKLPNEKTVKKEKVIKNSGKNSVIVIAINQDKEYIITFQNRINDKIIAEFPAGYIENNETPIEAAKRELQEETGYVTNDLFMVDWAYTSPGIDNSITYIVIANNCIKTDKKNTNGTELINYGLFKETELEYLINKNIMNGAMNKLAYYNLINNVDDCNTINLKDNKQIYKKKKERKNPLYK